MVDTSAAIESINYPGKSAVVKVWGTFGGATIQFQTSAPQTNPAVWIPIADPNGNTNVTTNTQGTISSLVQNEVLRVVQSGSGAGTTLNVSVELT
jgi:hypothetical protein